MKHLLMGGEKSPSEAFNVEAFKSLVILCCGRMFCLGRDLNSCLMMLNLIQKGITSPIFKGF
jgi:hypothetical protein